MNVKELKELYKFCSKFDSSIENIMYYNKALYATDLYRIVQYQIDLGEQGFSIPSELEMYLKVNSNIEVNNNIIKADLVSIELIPLTNKQKGICKKSEGWFDDNNPKEENATYTYNAEYIKQSIECCQKFYAKKIPIRFKHCKEPANSILIEPVSEKCRIKIITMGIKEELL